MLFTSTHKVCQPCKFQSPKSLEKDPQESKGSSNGVNTLTPQPDPSKLLVLYQRWLFPLLLSPLHTFFQKLILCLSPALVNLWIPSMLIEDLDLPLDLRDFKVFSLPSTVTQMWKMLNIYSFASKMCSPLAQRASILSSMDGYGSHRNVAVSCYVVPQPFNFKTAFACYVLVLCMVFHTLKKCFDVPLQSI